MVCEYYRNKEGDWQWEKISICRIFGIEINMALLNYEFDRQLEFERNDAYAEGFLRGYKEGFEKEIGWRLR